MHELVVDFITSLDGYASAEGWPRLVGTRSPPSISPGSTSDLIATTRS